MPYYPPNTGGGEGVGDVVDSQDIVVSGIPETIADNTSLNDALTSLTQQYSDLLGVLTTTINRVTALEEANTI